MTLRNSSDLPSDLWKEMLPDAVIFESEFELCSPDASVPGAVPSSAALLTKIIGTEYYKLSLPSLSHTSHGTSHPVSFFYQSGLITSFGRLPVL